MNFQLLCPSLLSQLLTFDLSLVPGISCPGDLSPGRGGGSHSCRLPPYWHGLLLQERGGHRQSSALQDGSGRHPAWRHVYRQQGEEAGWINIRFKHIVFLYVSTLVLSTRVHVCSCGALIMSQRTSLGVWISPWRISSWTTWTFILCISLLD